VPAVRRPTSSSGEHGLGIEVIVSRRRRGADALVWTLVAVALLAEPASLRAQSEARTRVIRLDKNGLTDPTEDGLQVLQNVRRGDKVGIEFYPSRVFDLDGLDVPSKDVVASRAMSAARPFFVYPEDSHLLFATPKRFRTTLHPGTTTFFVAGAGAYRLRITRLSEAEYNAAVPNDNTASNASYVASIGLRCYAMNDPALIGRSEPVERPELSRLLTRMKYDASDGGAPTLYMFRDVVIAEDAAKPILVIELVQEQFGITGADTTWIQKECPGLTPLEQTALAADKAPLGKPQGVVIVQVAPDFDNAQVEFRTGVPTERATLQVADQRAGTLAHTSAALATDRFEFQVCYTTKAGTRRAQISGGPRTQCLPDRPIRVEVKEPLPGRVRYQPGAIAVNRFRDVRLTAHMVFLVDREAYFGVKQNRRGSRFNPIGRFINPSAGIQLGGGETIIVLLLGAHVKLVEEANLTTGLRFGNQGSGIPYRFDQNFYVGFSLDPVLFTRLRTP
jgi:hypothetical protein